MKLLVCAFLSGSVCVHVLDCLTLCADKQAGDGIGELPLKWEEATYGESERTAPYEWKTPSRQPPCTQTTQGGPGSSFKAAAAQQTAMANIAVQRIKREFKEVLKSEEVP